MTENSDPPTGSMANNGQEPVVRSQIIAGGQKVIQPSPELLQELQLQQQTASPAPQPIPDNAVAANPAAQVLTQSANNLPPTQSDQPPAANSIYPEATHGIGIDSNASGPSPTPAQTGTPIGSNRPKVIIAAVMVLGAFLVVFAALGLLSWIRVLGTRGINSSSSAFGILLAAGELILAIGILMRRETARAVYVILALLSLVFSLYGTYSYFNVVHRLNSSDQAYITRTQQQIAQNQNNSNLTAADKKQASQALQTDEQSHEQLSAINKGVILALVEGYAVSLIPLIFLTRPQVKEVFS